MEQGATVTCRREEVVPIDGKNRFLEAEKQRSHQDPIRGRVPDLNDSVHEKVPGGVEVGNPVNWHPGL